MRPKAPLIFPRFALCCKGTKPNSSSVCTKINEEARLWIEWRRTNFLLSTSPLPRKRARCLQQMVLLLLQLWSLNWASKEASSSSIIKTYLSYRQRPHLLTSSSRRHRASRSRRNQTIREAKNWWLRAPKFTKLASISLSQLNSCQASPVLRIKN